MKDGLQTSMKVVGTRRHRPGSALQDIDVLFRTVRQISPSQYICPRGIYRFTSHEEADAWMRKMLVKSTLATRQ
jgi:hypothetical protein